MAGHGDNRRVNPAGGFLEVEAIEAGEQDVGDKEDEDEVEDRGALVMKAVIERPVFAQVVEYAVLDLPAFVANLAELARGDE